MNNGEAEDLTLVSYKNKLNINKSDVNSWMAMVRSVTERLAANSHLFDCAR